MPKQVSMEQQQLNILFIALFKKGLKSGDSIFFSFEGTLNVFYRMNSGGIKSR